MHIFYSNMLDWSCCQIGLIADRLSVVLVLLVWESLETYRFVTVHNNITSTVNSFPSKPLFLHGCTTILLKTLWEKEKLLITSNFSFFHSVFYLFEELPGIFIKFKIVVYKLQTLRVLNLSFWKELLWHLTPIQMRQMH